MNLPVIKTWFYLSRFPVPWKYAISRGVAYWSFTSTQIQKNPTENFDAIDIKHFDKEYFYLRKEKEISSFGKLIRSIDG